jgi:hypothetical protein
MIVKVRSIVLLEEDTTRRQKFRSSPCDGIPYTDSIRLDGGVYLP